MIFVTGKIKRKALVYSITASYFWYSYINLARDIEYITVQTVIVYFGHSGQRDEHHRFLLSQRVPSIGRIEVSCCDKDLESSVKHKHHGITLSWMR